MLFCPDRAKWAPQGPRRRKLVRSCRPDLGSISLRVMPTCGLRWILSTRSGFTLKMQGFEPSIDLDVRNGFFQKGDQLKNLLGIFWPSAMGSRHPVKMQSIELAAILVAPSDFQNFFLGPLRAPQEPPGRGKSSVLAPSSPRSAAEQIDCIFTGWDGALAPPTL